VFLSKHEIQIVKYKAISELKTEAAKTRLSVMWWFLDPLLSMAIYYLLFGVLLERYGIDFIPALIMGLVTYQWFMGSFSSCINSINGSTRLIMQLKFNKAILPTVQIAISTFKSALVFTALLITLWIIGITPTINYLYLPFILATQGLLIFACSYLIAAIIPFLPDMKNLVAHSTRVLMYVSGILYPLSVVPEQYKELFLLNPIAFLIHTYRQILIYGEAPDLKHLLIVALCSCFLLVIATYNIHRLNDRFARVLLQR
jgi:lipopolysaccharide transport system permease protein